jgi:membrane-associated protease RseP (regulator of RpoE activity)
MPSGKWGREVDYNLFTTSDADRLKYLINGCDAHSLTGDPLFMNRMSGDYRVRQDSPAIKLGFQNFSMEDFGVQKPDLKKIARTPRLPGDEPPTEPPVRESKKILDHFWLGATIREISGDEFSAFGIPKDSGGVHLQHVPEDSVAADAGFQSNDLIQSLSNQPVKSVADLLRLQNAAAGQPLEIRIIRKQKPEQITVTNYLFAVTESADADGFEEIQLEQTKAVIQLASLTSQPATNNEPLTTLFDGKLANNYGPVFSNGVEGGLYKVDLGRSLEIKSINTWSFQQNGNRGPQHFRLYGSKSESDPGWNLADPELFVPIAEVDSTSLVTAAKPFQATSVRSSSNQPLGTYRWLIWQAESITPIGENSAFQEMQVISP